MNFIHSLQPMADLRFVICPCILCPLLSPSAVAFGQDSLWLVEPVMPGAGSRFDHMAFNELEMSELDPGQRGKRMWVDSESVTADDTLSGKLETLEVRQRFVPGRSFNYGIRLKEPCDSYHGPYHLAPHPPEAGEQGQP